jgi:hypothetical protein
VTPCASCKCATSCANGPSALTLPPAEIPVGRPGGHSGADRWVGGPGERYLRWRAVTIASATSEAEMDGHLRRIADDGYTILEHAIDLDFIDEIAEALRRLEDELGAVPADNLFEGVHTTRVYNLLVHGPTFEKIPVHPDVLPVVERVLDPGALISSLSSIAIGPGERAQPIHADDQVIPLARPHIPIICNTMWAITDFTEAPRASSAAATSGTTPPIRSSTTTPSPPKCRRAACWSGWAASGTGAVRI